MLNLTKQLMILVSNSELSTLIADALRLISEIFATANKNFRTAISKVNKLYESEISDDIDELLTEWYAFITHSHGENHHSQIKRRQDYLANLTATDIDRAKTILKLVFVYLHKHKAVILTPNFSRPRGSITALPDMQQLFYSEIIYPFLDLEANSPRPSGQGKRAYTATQRLWQTGIKALLMTSFFTPEDITVKILKQLRAAQLTNKRNGVIPIPVAQICETLRENFSGRISADVEQWVATALSMKDSAPVQHDSGEENLVDLLNKHSSPFEIALGLAKYRRFGVSSFSTDNLHTYRLDIHIHQGRELFKKAMDVWQKAEQAYFDHQDFEKDKQARLAIGKINIYLFVYLPLWILQHPLSKFKYPHTPAEFTASVHFDCSAADITNRPLSLCELFRSIGYVESNGSQSDIRTFFSYLIEYGNELEGCAGVRQPVRRVPQSKAPANVKKNVFTGEQLRQFIAYHNALNAGADYYLQNSSLIGTVVEEAQKNRTHVDMADLGFVPIMYHNGKISYIRRIHPNTLSFVTHDHALYYNPGCVTFSLFLLESGVRGQTLQWLDAESYDRTSQRLSQDSLQLTTIWLNTDKIHKIPVIILTSMSNLWLLDAQRSWRQFMIEEVGVTGFTNEIYYDHEPKSHWGKITPLFVANPKTGDPFTDKQYTDLWNYHCLNFQTWYKENTTEKLPIVGFLPLRESSEKTYFTWEEWVVGINPDEVLILPGSSTNKLYQGDYCPISLRAYATPHGARASFITDFSTNLPPEAVALLTGQSISTIIRYNKGHHLLKDRLQGAFNNRDAAWFLSNQFHNEFSMADARDRLGDSLKQGVLPKAIEKLGLHSFPTSTSPREMTGLKLIATDRSLSLGACHTHICPYNFICPETILIKFKGEKRCAQCPFAIFSTHNLPAIEAQRQKCAEDYKSIGKIVQKHSANQNISAAEKSRLEIELKNSAKEVISWMLVGEVLWAKLDMQQQAENLSNGRDFVTADSAAVTRQITRAEYRQESVEGFLSRLDSACAYPNSISKEFEYKIDRGTRLLMINNGEMVEAAMMPSNFPNAVKLAGMIRSNLNFQSFDLDQFVQLINLTDKDWQLNLLSYRTSTGKPGESE